VQPRGGGGGSLALWLVSSLLVLVVASVAGYFVFKYVTDPYRTLESFPADKYLADYRPLMGNKWKADLKVSADLGVSPQAGRLMVFTLKDDSRPLVVLIPPSMDGLYFTKGQTYQATLEVEDKGIIYADTCEKE
jgi:hypothetical protein